jgi:hypothetical protein
MIARKLGVWRHVLVASPEWVRNHSKLRDPIDLAKHWILFDGVPFADQWVFERGASSVTVHMGSAIVCSDGNLVRTALYEGVGVTAAPLLCTARYRRWPSRTGTAGMAHGACSSLVDRTSPPRVCASPGSGGHRYGRKGRPHRRTGLGIARGLGIDPKRLRY